MGGTDAGRSPSQKSRKRKRKRGPNSQAGPGGGQAPGLASGHSQKRGKSIVQQGPPFVPPRIQPGWRQPTLTRTICPIPVDSDATNSALPAKISIEDADYSAELQEGAEGASGPEQEPGTAASASMPTELGQGKHEVASPALLPVWHEASRVQVGQQPPPGAEGPSKDMRKQVMDLYLKRGQLDRRRWDVAALRAGGPRHAGKDHAALNCKGACPVYEMHPVALDHHSPRCVVQRLNVPRAELFPRGRLQGGADECKDDLEPEALSLIFSRGRNRNCRALLKRKRSGKRTRGKKNKGKQAAQGASVGAGSVGPAPVPALDEPPEDSDSDEADDFGLNQETSGPHMAADAPEGWTGPNVPLAAFPRAPNPQPWQNMPTAAPPSAPPPRADGLSTHAPRTMHSAPAPVVPGSRTDEARPGRMPHVAAAATPGPSACAPGSRPIWFPGTSPLPLWTTSCVGAENASSPGPPAPPLDWSPDLPTGLHDGAAQRGSDQQLSAARAAAGSKEQGSGVLQGSEARVANERPEETGMEPRPSTQSIPSEGSRQQAPLATMGAVPERSGPRDPRRRPALLAKQVAIEQGQPNGAVPADASPAAHPGPPVSTPPATAAVDAAPEGASTQGAPGTKGMERDGARVRDPRRQKRAGSPVPTAERAAGQQAVPSGSRQGEVVPCTSEANAVHEETGAEARAALPHAELRGRSGALKSWLAGGVRAMSGSGEEAAQEMEWEIEPGEILPADADEGMEDVQEGPATGQQGGEGARGAQTTEAEAQRRMAEAIAIIQSGKLCLVLDLDHTLLNSVKVSELSPDLLERLVAKEAAEKANERFRRREIFHVAQLGIWTKLRPGIWTFLDRVRHLFELHIYTLGTKAYAAEMARILDPTGELFSGRIISKGLDSIREIDLLTAHHNDREQQQQQRGAPEAGTSNGSGTAAEGDWRRDGAAGPGNQGEQAVVGPTTGVLSSILQRDTLATLSLEQLADLERRVLTRSKDLEGVLGREDCVLILDDSANVWPHHARNLITMERYTYFPASRRQLGMTGPSLLERGHDEREEVAMLLSALALLERIHAAYFEALRATPPSAAPLDVRHFLEDQRRRVLAGCHILFSRVFPVSETNPQQHPLWRLAEQYGAVCYMQQSEAVTHVVAAGGGTNKVNWARATHRYVVSKTWLEASTVLYRRMPEDNYPVI